MRLLSAATALLGLAIPFVPAGPATSVPPVAADQAIERAVRSGASCVTFDGLRYCLGLGFTSKTEREANADLARLATIQSARTTRTEQTGDVDTAPGGPPSRTAADRRAEFLSAAASVSKVRDLSSTRTTTAARTAYPTHKSILDPRKVSEQVRTYYCGPSSMQMIEWNWNNTKQSQAYWGGRLGTTTSGSSIWDMVRVTNEATGWDRSDYAGKYIVLDISGYGFRGWFHLLRKHVATYRAPVILHPILHKRYFSYLDDDASGHFQVGRGYDAGGDYRRIGYFEPWNQQRFNSSEPYIARRQWQRAFNSFRANQAHPAHNLGL